MMAQQEYIKFLRQSQYIWKKPKEKYDGAIGNDMHERAEGARSGYFAVLGQESSSALCSTGVSYSVMQSLGFAETFLSLCISSLHGL